MKKKKKAPSLGIFLKEARLAAQLSQRDVADKLGYESVQLISDWERGLRTPPANTLKTVSEIYRISTQEFYEIFLQEKVRIIEQNLKKDFGIV